MTFKKWKKNSSSSTDINHFTLESPIRLKVIPPCALLWEQACNTAPVGRSPTLISPGINHTLPVPRGERDESGGELEIVLMSRQVSPPLWPFQKLLILLVVSGLEIITSSNPCNTAWPAVQTGQFKAGRMEEGGMERLQRWEWVTSVCTVCAVYLGRDFSSRL